MFSVKTLMAPPSARFLQCRRNSELKLFQAHLCLSEKKLWKKPVSSIDPTHVIPEPVIPTPPPTPARAGAARTILRSAGVSWVERLTGVCRLVAPGLLVEVV